MDTKRIWRCNCGGNHFIVLSSFNRREGERDVYLGLILEDSPDGLWERIKAAAAILWRGRSLTGEVLLDAKAEREFAAEVARLVEGR